MSRELPLWAEATVATLLALSGILVVISAIGLVRLKDFFVRMHPPALAYTGGTWSVAVGGMLYFGVVDPRAALKPLIIITLLFVTVPVTSLLLARVVLFRNRRSGVAGTPPPLTHARDN